MSDLIEMWKAAWNAYTGDTFADRLARNSLLASATKDRNSEFAKVARQHARDYPKGRP